MRRISHGITGFVLRRVLLGVVTLLLVSLVVFAATQALPSDPARAILGRTSTPESVATLRKQLDLNHSAVYQYTHWLGRFVTGNLGKSLAARGEPVTKVLGARIENSTFLVFLFGTSVFHLLPAVSLIPPGDAPWQHLTELVLPTLTLVLAVSPYIARIMRASLVEVLESDFVEIATILVSPRLRTSLR